MQQSAPQQPRFLRIPKNFLTEEQLNEKIPVVMIKVRGSYSMRGEHRREIVEKHFVTEIEVPEDFNIGQVKLSVNRVVRNKFNGIRIRQYHVDKESQPRLLEYKRLVRDFISDRGIRHNGKRQMAYEKEVARRRAEAESMEDGEAPTMLDETIYGPDGLPMFSDKVYVAQTEADEG